MTPWGAMLRHAVRELRLPPRAFWRLSLVEWRWLVERDGPAPLTRAELAALMEKERA